MASSYIAWYLFLAGAGGGAFVIGAFVDLALRFKDPACLARVSSVTDAGLVAGPALVALALGLGLLRQRVLQLLGDHDVADLNRHDGHAPLGRFCPAGRKARGTGCSNPFFYCPIKSVQNKKGSTP